MSGGLLADGPEPDDSLHNPDPIRDHKVDKGGHIFSSRGLVNLGCLLILAAGILLEIGLSVGLTVRFVAPGALLTLGSIRACAIPGWTLIPRAFIPIWSVQLLILPPC